MPGLHSKCLYLLSHLASLTLVFFNEKKKHSSNNSALLLGTHFSLCSGVACLASWSWPGDRFSMSGGVRRDVRKPLFYVPHQEGNLSSLLCLPRLLSNISWDNHAHSSLQGSCPEEMDLFSQMSKAGKLGTSKFIHSYIHLFCGEYILSTLELCAGTKGGGGQK